MNKYRATYHCTISNPPRDYVVEFYARSGVQAKEIAEHMAGVNEYPSTKVTKLEQGQDVIKPQIVTEWTTIAEAKP